MERFREGLVFKGSKIVVSLNSRLESDKEEEEEIHLSSCVFTGRRDTFQMPWSEPLAQILTSPLLTIHGIS